MAIFAVNLKRIVKLMGEKRGKPRVAENVLGNLIEEMIGMRSASAGRFPFV